MLCRREGIAQSLYYNWSKEFLETGKKRLSGDMARQASTGIPLSHLFQRRTAADMPGHRQMPALLPT